MARRDIVVIGGSAGAIESATQIVRGLSDDFPAAVFVVVHFPGSVTSALPRILNRAGPLPAAHPENESPFHPGRINVAPPDCHLYIEDGTIRLSPGPKENGHRPAIDPLFRSAAHHYGPRVIGLLLSGNLSDGTAGLLSIKQHGGTAIVQDPEGAVYSGMPRSAIRRGASGPRGAVEAVAGLLEQLTAEPSPPRKDVPMEAPGGEDDTLDEVAIEDRKIQAGIPSTISCPECHGVLWEHRRRQRTGVSLPGGARIHRGGPARHPGGAGGAALWTALRALEEHSALSRLLAARAAHRGHSHSASTFTEHAMDAEHHASTIRVVLSAGVRGKVTAAGVLEHHPES